ncbi:MAG TPA: flavodoxin [Chloroflexota bacterium]
MKALVVYDSKFGNTERVARVIAETLGAGEPVPTIPAGEASERDLIGIDLLAVGGPTQAHGLSPVLRDFLDGLSSGAVSDRLTVSFDTRLNWPRFLAGSAASAAAKRLTKKGARLLATPESFLVNGSKGPLAERELERAATWTKELRTAAGLLEQASAAIAP